MVTQEISQPGIARSLDSDAAQRHPCVHKFETAGKKYFLDVNTNRVVRVDAVTWSLVDDFGPLTKAEWVARHEGEYGQAAVAAAYDEINAMQQRRSLLRSRSCELADMPDRRSADTELEGQRRKVTLCVTEDCNFRCDYCVYGGNYRYWRTHSKAQMSWEVARLAIDDYIRHSHLYRDSPYPAQRSIAFYGGEPLLNAPLIRQCISYARDKLADQVIFHVTTNGSLLHGEIADFLASENTTIQVSLNGPSHIHDYHRRFQDGAGTWELVTRNVREFLEKHPQYNTGEAGIPCLSLTATLLPLQNLLEVEDFFCTQASQILHFDADVRFGTVRHTDGKYLESLAPADRRLPGQATLYKRFLANVASGLINRDPFDHKWTFQRLFFEKPFQTFLNREIASPERPCLDGRSRLYTMCIPGKTGCFVSVDGNYYTCERAPNCETFRIGDVWHGIDTARSYKLWSGFVKMCDDECRRCWCVNLCRIGCCAFVREGDECSPKAKREACDRYRASMHRMLTDLFTVLESNPHAFDYLKNADRRNAGAAGPEEK